MKIQSLPTEYEGITYRSRTEAKWAVFFKGNHIPFAYEAEGFDLGGVKYLPDFLMTVGNCWFEVKPFDPTSQEVDKAKRLAVATRKLVFIAPGSPRKDIGLFAVSPTGRVLTNWKFAWAHEQGVGYLVDCLWRGNHRVKIANVTNHAGMYGYGPDCELERAGHHHFQWKGAHPQRDDGGAYIVPRREVRLVPSRNIRRIGRV